MRSILPILVFFMVLSGCSQQKKEQPPQESNETAPPERTMLPTSLHNNRFLVEPTAQNGDTLSFLVDSGDGFSRLWKTNAEAMALEPRSAVLRDDSVQVVNGADFLSDNTISASEHQFVVYEKPEEIIEKNTGTLGSHWLAEGIWQFDYANEALYRINQINWEERNPEQRIKLHFKKNPQGAHEHIHPRFPVVVDGDTLQMVFDTGAQTALSDNAKYALAPEHQLQRVGISFIMRSVFLKWRTDNPDWKVVEEGDKGYNDTPIIQVPSVSIAGQESGPVWFAVRDDRIYNDHMLQMMDAPVHGSIGGNALQYFDVIVDYPAAQAEFVRNTVNP